MCFEATCKTPSHYVPGCKLIAATAYTPLIQVLTTAFTSTDQDHVEPVTIESKPVDLSNLVNFWGLEEQAANVTHQNLACKRLDNVLQLS